MNEWDCADVKCVRKLTESRLSLTHRANKSSGWAFGLCCCDAVGAVCNLYKMTANDLAVLPECVVKQIISECFQMTVDTQAGFYRAALNARRSSGEKGISLSVCETRGLWQNGKKSVQIFIPYERSFSLVFLEKEWLVGWPLLPKILGQTDRFGAKSPIFIRYSLVAPQPLSPSEKSSINTNRKSTTRFPMNLRWSSYVVPKPPKGLKNKINS